MSRWIDFKRLREKLSFEAVLRHYNVDVKTNKGRQHHGFCPLPNHQGKRNSQSFSANLEKGVFHCFGCGAKGNLLDFAVLMEKLSPDAGADVRKVALMLQDKFFAPEEKPKETKAKKAAEPELLKLGEEKQVRAVINAPLDFELKKLDANHAYLDKRGFQKEIIARFGLGYCEKGLLAGRIAIPIHRQPDGRLIGYAGRIVDEGRINNENPRYKFPPKREHNGVTYEFHKTLVVYNAHRITAPVEDLIVVEGFASVWWITQMGLADVVALMGWACSPEQGEIITNLVSPEGRVFVITDGDEAGERCAGEVFREVGSSRFVKWVKLEPGKQPTDYPGGWLRQLVGK